MKGKFITFCIVSIFSYFFCGEIYASEIKDYLKEGTTLLKEGKFTEAAKEFESAIASGENLAGARFNLGCAYALQGKHKKAINEFKKVLKIADLEEKGFAYFNLGGIWFKEYFNAGKKEKMLKSAAEHFMKSAEIIPYFQLAKDYATYTDMWASSAKFMEPEKGYKLTITETGICPDSSIFLDAEHFLGQGEQRICVFDKDSPPLLYFYKSPSTYLLWGISNREQGNLQEAKRNFNTALQLLDDETENHLNKLAKWNAYLALADLSLSKNEWDKAIALTRKAQDLNLKYSSEYLALIYAYEDQHNYSKVKETAKLLLEIKPDDKAAKKLASLDISSLRLNNDGWYQHKKYKLKIKKPRDWLLLDAETNSEMFREFIDNDPNSITTFSYGLSSDAPFVNISFTPTEKSMSNDEFLDIISKNTDTLSVNNPTIKIGKRPHFIELGNKKFISYLVHLPATEAPPMTSIFYYLVKENGFYTLAFQLNKSDFMSLNNDIEGIAASLTIE